MASVPTSPASLTHQHRSLTQELGVPRPETEVHRINFAWLIRLRWVAITGQSAVVIASQFMTGVNIPTLTLLVILALEALSNLALIAWARTDYPRHELMAAVVLAADLLFLTALLFFTGGAQNPFTPLYFVHVALAALVLRPLWTWAITALSIAAYLSLFFASQAHQALAWSDAPELWVLPTTGRWAAFILTACVIAFFINRIQRALKRRERELTQVRQAQMRSEKLASLATLAAGAAHEFSTPLSTIALVANELQRGLDDYDLPSRFAEDAQLIRDQVERCHDILHQMSADAGESMGEFARPVSVPELVDHILDGCRDPERVQISMDTDRPITLTVPPSALGQALRGLLNNALEASDPDDPVDMTLHRHDRFLRLQIRDRGEGMCPAVLQRVDEPFFSTKPEGQGMGLGVFLARTLIEKINGQLHFESTPGQGTTVTVDLPTDTPSIDPSSPPATSPHATGDQP